MGGASGRLSTHHTGDFFKIMKIEHSRDDGIAAFVIGKNEFVFSRDENGGDEITRLEMKMLLVDNASEVELFSGPGDKRWTVQNLSEFVFGVDRREQVRTVAELVSLVAVSAAKIQGVLLTGESLSPMVVELRTKWFEWSYEAVKGFSWQKGESEGVAIARLVTACQFVFNEWINIGEEVFRFETVGERSIVPVVDWDN